MNSGGLRESCVVGRDAATAAKLFAAPGVRGPSSRGVREPDPLEGEGAFNRWWCKLAGAVVGVRGEPAVESDITAGLRRGASKGFLSIALAFGVVGSLDDQSFSIVRGRNREGR